MTIKVGDKLPSATLTLATAEGPKPVTTEDFFGGKKVALFALPGAFTPTCSAKHLPGFKQLAGEIKAKGVDAIACLSVNDAFVMRAWTGLPIRARNSVTARSTAPPAHHGRELGVGLVFHEAEWPSTPRASAWVSARSAIR